MKRLTICGVPISLRVVKWALLVIILAVLPVVCLAQYQQKVRVKQVEKVQPPEPRLKGPVSLEQTLAKRRSVREFTSQPLDFEQIGQLAWAGQGITEKQKGFRTAPSAGAIYPIKLYFATQMGLFVYHPNEHSLEEIFSLDVRNKLAVAALNQEVVANAACDIIIAGSEKKLAAKYSDKARRYMLLEAGHIAQNIHLQVVSLGLGAVPVGAFDIRDVSKVCELPTDLEPLLIVCVGYPAGQVAAEKDQEKKEVRKIDSKKAVLIAASEKFRDEELFETKRILNDAKIETVIASTKTGVIKGMLGGKADAEILVNDIDVNDYDAIIFVGGPGAREYFNSQVALNIARKAEDKKKVLAAICVAPTVLANAGVLDGVKATSFLSERLRLKKSGAKYTGASVERDGLIITGSGPRATRKFAKAIVDALQESAK